MDRNLNLLEGQGSCRHTAPEVWLKYSSKNCVPVRPVERIKTGLGIVAVSFQLEQDLLLVSSHAGEHIQHKADQQKKQGDYKEETCSKSGPLVGGKEPGTQIMLAQENGKSQTQQKHNETHETKEAKGFVVPKPVKKEALYGMLHRHLNVEVERSV